MPDIVSIDPTATDVAGRILRSSADRLAESSGLLRVIDVRGADLEPWTAPPDRGLSEVVEELGLLGELLTATARLAVFADSHSASQPDAVDSMVDAIADARRRLDASLVDGFGAAGGELAIDPEWSADQIRDWWNALGIADRRLLEQFDPMRIGNLDGVPFDARIRANRTTLELMATDPSGIDPRITQFLAPDGAVDETRKLVVFDPTGAGRVAELFGDLEAAIGVAVVVPGMGSSMSNFDEIRGGAERVWGGNPDLAVIAWTGYHAPRGLVAPTSPAEILHDVIALDEVADDRLARAGARRLTGFDDGLTTETDASTTYIGHSYGSLVVGHAVQQGLTADRVAFLGSPGVGVDSVDEFPDGSVDRYFAADAHGDPVADLEWFGDAPTDPDFGAETFDVGELDGVLLGLHDDYFDESAAAELRTIALGGDPTPDDPPIGNSVAEFMDDHGLPGESVVENVGAHVQEAVREGARRAADVASETVDRLDDAIGEAVDAAGQLLGAGIEVASTSVDRLETALDTVGDVGLWTIDLALGN